MVGQCDYLRKTGTGASTVCLVATFSFSFCSGGFHLCTYISRPSTKTGTLSSTGVLSVPFVGNRDGASAAWHLMPVQCTMLSSNSDKRCRHRDSFQEASDFAMSHLRALWSVLTVNRIHCRYGRSKKLADIMARHYLLVATSWRSESLSFLDHYPVALSVPSSFV